MTEHIAFEGITVDVQRKRVKNINLRVCRRTGQISLSAPRSVSAERLEIFLREKKEWILSKLPDEKTVQASQLEYRDGELLSVWGRSCVLMTAGRKAGSRVEYDGSTLLLHIPPAADAGTREKAICRWYAAQVNEAAAPLIARWSRVLGVGVKQVRVRRMSSRWGSCMTAKGIICLNSELGRLAPEYLDYVVLHELAHLLEPSHNERFKAILTRHMPDWRVRRGRMRSGVC